ncbi:MAG: type II toxin-antitoxin system VapC family toxin [Rhizobium sp.]|nr:type II toxin-antitoxin system VapC family toxin [Rhizobium sp.]
MIAIDTSALMAIVRNEATADDCQAVLEANNEVCISAGTLAEALIVATARGHLQEIRDLVDRLRFTVIDATEETAERAALAYARWGKGNHPAGLNFGDCFAYALAEQLNCPLLFVGDDFSRTDIRPALPT